MPVSGKLFYVSLMFFVMHYRSKLIPFVTMVLMCSSNVGCFGLSVISGAVVGRPDKDYWKKEIGKANVALRTNRHDAKAYHHRAFAHLMLRNYRYAIIDAESAIENDPTMFRAYSTMARAHMARRNYRAALTDLSKGIAQSAGQEAGFLYFQRAGVHRILNEEFLEKVDRDKAKELGFKPDFQQSIFLSEW